MNRTRLLLPLCSVAALGLGLFAGYVDLGKDEPQPAALAILVFAFLVTAVAGSRPWLFGILAGLGVFLAHAGSRLMGAAPVPGVQLATTLIAIVPGLIGAYLGFAARRMLGAVVGTA